MLGLRLITSVTRARLTVHHRCGRGPAGGQGRPNRLAWTRTTVAPTCGRRSSKGYAISVMSKAATS